MQTARVVSVVAVLAALGAAFWFMSPRDEAEDTAPPLPVSKRGLIEFTIVPSIADRFVQEPCNGIPGAGLYSLGIAILEVKKRFPGLIQLSMGDLTLAEGGMGRLTSRYHYTEIFPRLGDWIVCAGEGELGTGVEFLKGALTRIDGVKLLCANAADPAGPAGPVTFLSAYQILKSGERNILVIGVAADSMQEELARRGSDVVILPAAAAIEQARKDGTEHAALTRNDIDEYVLLVHGTVDETAALLEKSPGFTIAVAAHGPVLADQEPRMVGRTPVYYGGQGMRFVWRVILPDDGSPPASELTRIGQSHQAAGSFYSDDLAFFRDMSSRLWMDEVAKTAGERPPDPRGRYVGAAKCAECHADVAKEHEESAHGTVSKILHGSNFVGSTGCVGCHTTAPYRDTGWPGPPDRSDLAAISCEACHGPGEGHVVSQEKGWGKVEFTSCAACHLPDRLRRFDAEALWKQFGHRLVK